MYINVTMKQNNAQVDIRIDAEQPIAEGLNIVINAGKLPPLAVKPDYFRSYIRNTLVSAYKTFTQEAIYDGDILEAVTPHE